MTIIERILNLRRCVEEPKDWMELNRGIGPLGVILRYLLDRTVHAPNAYFHCLQSATCSYRDQIKLNHQQSLSPVPDYNLIPAIIKITSHTGHGIHHHPTIPHRSSHDLSLLLSTSRAIPYP